MNTLAVILGAVLGALLRWRLSVWLNATDAVMNWGTLLVNVSGSAFAGVVLAWHSVYVLPSVLWLLIVVGFLGGFTTFSAYSIEFVQLLLKGSWQWAILHVLIHVLLSLLAVSLSYLMMLKLLS